MPQIDIITSAPAHVHLMGHSLREADAREITCLGLLPHWLLYRSYKRSLLRKTAFIDGKIAAMWGVAGTPMGMVGNPWLLTAPACEQVSPISFAHIYRKEAAAMLRLFPTLLNFVHADYHQAVRLLQISGFVIEPALPLGKTGEMFRRFTLEQS